MAKNYLGPGAKLDIPPNVITVARSSGDLHILDDVVGVVLHDGAANAANVLQIEGIFQGPKMTGVGSGSAIGKKAYAVDDAGTVKFTADPTGATAAGFFAVTAEDADTTAQVRLAGGPAVP